MASNNLNLLHTLNRIEVPYIKVVIGDYTFGVYQKTDAKLDYNGFYTAAKIQYPNYVKSLNITKINGQVNTYTLTLTYNITANDDPNFFEKVFSSVSKTRKIVFSYGDMSLPSYVYKDEEALITDVKTTFNMKSSSITYTVSAVSSATLLSSGCYPFIYQKEVKPSDEIKRILKENKTYGLQDIFYGMANLTNAQLNKLIPGTDKRVTLESHTNTSVLDQLTYLVNSMIPSSSKLTQVKQKTFYVLKIVDDTTGEYGGPYFKIEEVTKDIESSDAYEIDIGFPTANIVKEFNIDNNENFSIFYDWQKELNNEEFVERLDDNGEWYTEYAPIISSKNPNYRTRLSDMVWWSKVTEYPISATIKLKGLIRPAILMSKVRLRCYFYGQKHLVSGLYIITKQQDSISERGYETTLSLTRISGDDNLID